MGTVERESLRREFWERDPALSARGVFGEGLIVFDFGARASYGKHLPGADTEGGLDGLRETTLDPRLHDEPIDHGFDVMFLALVEGFEAFGLDDLAVDA